MSNAPIATIAPAFAIDLCSNPNLRWQIRCSGSIFNGTPFATREEAASYIATMFRCEFCGKVTRKGSPHAMKCPTPRD
ncbi:MAG: hypothetical protein RIR41_1624 [Pseudomonadota bacterium]|jgi:hypothetical protein